MLRLMQPWNFGGYDDRVKYGKEEKTVVKFSEIQRGNV